jgi:hypothetical protein
MKNEVMNANAVSVKVNSIVMSGAAADGSTQFAINLTFSNDKEKDASSQNYSVDGNTKVPGGSGIMEDKTEKSGNGSPKATGNGTGNTFPKDQIYDLMFELKSKPKILKSYISNAAGISYVNIEMIIPSKEALFAGSQEERISSRVIEIQNPPVNICNKKNTTIMVSPVSPTDFNTHVLMTFPV